MRTIKGGFPHWKVISRSGRLIGIIRYEEANSTYKFNWRGWDNCEKHKRMHHKFWLFCFAWLFARKPL